LQNLSQSCFILVNPCHIPYICMVQYKPQPWEGAMSREIARCGLDCTACKARLDVIRKSVTQLNEAFAAANVAEVSKEIPFMRFNYRGYKKITEFFSAPCPGCHQKGGNPFCGIRKCAQKRGYETCAECDSLCKKFKPLLRIHTDGEVQRNIEAIRKYGLDQFRFTGSDKSPEQ
jgi:hypothetical protein